MELETHALATKEQAGRPRVDDAIKVGLYLASDTYSLADVAVIPYILRLELLRLSPIWDGRRNVAAWWERVRQRSSTDTGDLQTDDGGGRRSRVFSPTHGPRCTRYCSPLYSRPPEPYR